MSTQSAFSRPILTVRVHAGLNAASLLAGLFTVSGMNRFSNADEFLHSRFPETEALLAVKPVSVNGIGGVSAFFEAPAEGHVHRTPSDIIAYYEHKSVLAPAARDLAGRIWTNVAAAEARVHNAPPEHVHFHEVGRMTNILAVGLIAELFAAMQPVKFVSSPLPLSDGTIHCAHGEVPNPAPATLAQLEGVAVCPYNGTGETVTPTGLAVLKGLDAEFDAWPEMLVRRQITAFAANKTFAGANGLILALGDAL